MHRLRRRIEGITQYEFSIRCQDLFLLYRIELLLKRQRIYLSLLLYGFFFAVGEQMVDLSVLFEHGFHTAVRPFFNGDAFGFTITHKNE